MTVHWQKELLQEEFCDSHLCLGHEIQALL